MAAVLNRFAAPAPGGDFTLLRDAAGGALWQRQDGLIVRIAAPEPERVADQEAGQLGQPLLALACADAWEQ